MPLLVWIALYLSSWVSGGPFIIKKYSPIIHFKSLEQICILTKRISAYSIELNSSSIFTEIVVIIPL